MGGVVSLFKVRSTYPGERPDGLFVRHSRNLAPFGRCVAAPWPLRWAVRRSLDERGVKLKRGSDTTKYIGRTRVLIALSPRMYREVIALSIYCHHPGLEVRAAPPEAVEMELVEFQPHLLVHTDIDGVPAETLADIPCRVEVLYAAGPYGRTSMDTKVSVDGKVSEAPDMSIEDLLRVVDRVSSLGDRGAAPG